MPVVVFTDNTVKMIFTMIFTFYLNCTGIFSATPINIDSYFCKPILPFYKTISHLI